MTERKYAGHTLAEIQAVAEAATPGPWIYFPKPKYKEHHVSLPRADSGMRRALFDDGCQTERPEADARFIAAANPATLLDMVARIVELETQQLAVPNKPATVAVPPGYKLCLIPKESTDEFNAACSAAYEESKQGTGPCGVFMAGHRAMLAAAPQPAAVAVPDGWQGELLDWVSACQSSYHIDNTPGHRFGGMGSNLEENRAAVVEYVTGLLTMPNTEQEGAAA